MLKDANLHLSVTLTLYLFHTPLLESLWLSYTLLFLELHVNQHSHTMCVSWYCILECLELYYGFFITWKIGNTEHPYVTEIRPHAPHSLLFAPPNWYIQFDDKSQKNKQNNTVKCTQITQHSLSFFFFMIETNHVTVGVENGYDEVNVQIPEEENEKPSSTNTSSK